MSAPETLDVDALPLPSELEPGGDADPDRPWAWRDHEDDERPGADDMPGGDPDDGPIDSDASFRAWQRLGIPLRFLPSQVDLDKSTAPRE